MTRLGHGLGQTITYEEPDDPEVICDFCDHGHPASRTKVLDYIPKDLHACPDCAVDIDYCEECDAWKRNCKMTYDGPQCPEHHAAYKGVKQ